MEILRYNKETTPPARTRVPPVSPAWDASPPLVHRSPFHPWLLTLPRLLQMQSANARARKAAVAAARWAVPKAPRAAWAGTPPTRAAAVPAWRKACSRCRQIHRYKAAVFYLFILSCPGCYIPVSVKYLNGKELI